MKKFNEIYSESTTVATFTIGYGEKAGKLVIITPSKDDRGTLIPWGSFFYDGATGTLSIGDVQMGTPGKVILGRVGSSRQAILLDAEKHNLTIGGYGNGSINLKNRYGNDTVSLDGLEATLTVGNKTTATSERADGQVVIKNGNGNEIIKLDGRYANLFLGGDGQDGDISIKNGGGNEVAHLGGNNGSLELKNQQSVTTISLDGGTGNIILGGGNEDGDITIKNASGNDTIVLNGSDGSITVGGVNAHGDIIVKNNNDIETIKITGSNGDIEFLNADVAEEFEIKEGMIEEVLPGMLVIVDEDSKLIPCEKPYDSRVVGIIAGGGNFRPGIVMDKNGGENRLPVAMIGKVYCLADADVNPIRVGDMLTTSSKKGHAMKATDKQKAFGTVVGKALAGLAQGTGLIPVLVNLQ